jgi:hypothetical protein
VEVAGTPSKKDLLFLKKKKQKDFHPFAFARNFQRPAKRIKVFWFFFSKKNILPSYSAAASRVLRSLASAIAHVASMNPTDTAKMYPGCPKSMIDP